MHNKKPWRPVLLPTACQLNFQIVPENRLCLSRWASLLVWQLAPVQELRVSSWRKAQPEAWAGTSCHLEQSGAPGMMSARSPQVSPLQLPLGRPVCHPVPWLGELPRHCQSLELCIFVAFHAEVFVATFHLLITPSMLEEFPTVWVLPPHFISLSCTFPASLVARAQIWDSGSTSPTCWRRGDWGREQWEREPVLRRIHFLEKAAIMALALEEDTRKFRHVVSSAKRSQRWRT